MLGFLLCLLQYIFYVYLVGKCIRLYARLTTGFCKSPTCLIGRTAIITGGNQGLGYETALALAGRGCRVIIADMNDGKEAVEKIKNTTHNPNIIYKHLNLASFKSIRAFVDDINATEEKLHILINNAGSVNFGNKVTEDGLHLGMATNHYGGFLLTYLLIDLLKKSAPSRIIFVSSKLAYFNKLNGETLVHRKSKGDMAEVQLYCDTKMCNIIASDCFAEKLRGSGVTSNSVHPGLVNTRIFARLHVDPLSKFLIRSILELFAKTPRDGAQTTIYAAIDEDIADQTGKHFSDCTFSGKPTLAYNKQFCKTLWETSEKLVKITEEEKL